MITCVLVTQPYRDAYLEGWDARMSDLYVNPYIKDFETIRYQAWKDGWLDADHAIKEDDDGAQTV